MYRTVKIAAGQKSRRSFFEKEVAEWVRKGMCNVNLRRLIADHKACNQHLELVIVIPYVVDDKMNNLLIGSDVAKI